MCSVYNSFLKMWFQFNSLCLMWWSLRQFLLLPCVTQINLQIPLSGLDRLNLSLRASVIDFPFHKYCNVDTTWYLTHVTHSNIGYCSSNLLLVSNELHEVVHKLLALSQFRSYHAGDIWIKVNNLWKYSEPENIQDCCSIP